MFKNFRFFLRKLNKEGFPSSEFSSCSSFVGWTKQSLSFFDENFSAPGLGKKSKMTGKSITGFSLVETIVAVAIIILAIIGPLSLASRGIISAEYSRDQMRAYYLAEEGLEYVHYVRDVNILNKNPDGWLGGFSNCNVAANSSAGCGVDPNVNDSSNIRDCFNPEITPSVCNLFFDSDAGTYTHNSTNNQSTIFRRWLKIYDVTNTKEKQIVVSVEWKTGSLPPRTINVSSFITDWKEQVDSSSMVVLPTPIAWWKFDESSGLTAADFYGGPSGTLKNGATFAVGRVGNAVSLDGVDDYVDFGTSPALSPAGGMTVAFWTKNNVAPILWDTLLLRATNAGWADGWGFWYNDGSTIKFYVGNYGLGASATINPLQWNYIVGTWDGTTVKIYVNGTAGTNGNYGLAQTGTTQTLATRGTDNLYNINGLIDDIRIYNRALTPAEVQTLYSSF